MKYTKSVNFLLLAIGAFSLHSGCSDDCPTCPEDHTIPFPESRMWHVSPLGDDVYGTGSQVAPFLSLMHAITISTDGDTILAAPGTYREAIEYLGKAIVVGSRFLETNDWTDVQATTIDGDSSATVVTFREGESLASELVGFTVTRGNHINGGGIVCTAGSSPTLRSLNISNNTAAEYGGGIYCELASRPNLLQVRVSDNHAGGGGGGMALIAGSSAIIVFAEIHDNTVSGSGSYGGGLYSEASSPLISASDISSNIARTGGGSYFCQGSRPVLTNVAVEENFARLNGGGFALSSSYLEAGNLSIRNNTADGDGGGMYLESTGGRITDSVIENNTTPQSYGGGAGVFAMYDCSPVFTRVDFFRNSAESMGGAMHFQHNCHPVFMNVSFVSNSSGQRGGAVNCAFDCSPVFQNVIMTMNSSSSWQSGGGLSMGAGVHPHIINSIIYDNYPDQFGFTTSHGRTDTLSISYSLVAGGLNGIEIDSGSVVMWGDGNIDLDPSFTDPKTGDFRLSEESPCIDAGHPNPEYNDLDGSRNDLGMYGGPEALQE